MSWNRKYRPSKISQLALKNVQEILMEMINGGKIPQVLLFAGPKGTGKTSSARIIASILNDPQNAQVVEEIFFKKSNKKQILKEPELSNDIVKRIHAGVAFGVQELDAASNRGIDDVRSLKERLALPPQEGKISVYILDEVHMLTTEAFNALLKMLEETPPHVVFILATTELHKIPATVLSRCSVIHFRQANQAELIATLKNILEQEKIRAELGCLELIAQAADGSFRDAIKLLELVSLNKNELKLADVENKLQTISSVLLEKLLTALLEKNAIEIVDIFKDLKQRQVDPKYFHKSLLNFIHEQLLQHFSTKQESKYELRVLHFLLKEFNQIDLQLDSIPFLSLELKFLELIFRSKKDNGTSADKEKQVKKKLKSDNLQIVDHGDGQRLLSAWDNFVSEVEKRQAVIAMLLKSSKPLAAQNGSVDVQVYYPFHKERLEERKNISLLQECLQPLAGGQVELNFVLNENHPEDQPELAEEILL